jgi:hypothetical protein
MPAAIARSASRLAEIAFTEDQFHNPELLLGAARAGLRVIDVPVTIRRRTAGVTKRAPTCAMGSSAGDAQDLAALAFSGATSPDPRTTEPSVLRPPLGAMPDLDLRPRMTFSQPVARRC